MAKIGSVSVESLRTPLPGSKFTSLRAADFIAPNERLKGDIRRLEDHLAGTQTALVGKRVQLELAEIRERDLVKEGKLVLL